MMLTTLQLSEALGTLSYRAAGKGEPLVLLHGVGMQSAAWTPQVRALSHSHQVIALDMPGHGGSSPLPSDALLPDYVAWLHEALVALDLGPVNLAGHSMGALIAGGFAVTHPQMLRRVALLNGVFLRSSEARQAVLGRAEEIRNGQIDLETPLTRWFDNSPADQAARAEVATWLGAVDPGGYGTAYTAFAKGDDTYADRYTEIPCPFLALTGTQDPNSTPAMSQQMAETAPRGEVEIIPGRHMINLTKPDAVNAILSRWLSRPEAATDPQEDAE